MSRAAGLALAAALAAAPAGAQWRASLDAGVSHVEYDGFLPSSALSLTPAVRMANARLGLVARATWLRFESGNNSVQGLVAGSLLFPASTGVAADLGAELGASRYEDFARFSHALGRARLQFSGRGGESGWVSTTIGATASDSARRWAQGIAGGLRLDRQDVTLAFGVAATFIGAASYADLETTIRHGRPGRLEAEAVVSARAGDPNNDPGPYVEATLTLPVMANAAIVVAGGRYAADALRGNVAGRYVSAALRLAAPVRRPRPIAHPSPDDPPSSEGSIAAALLEVRRGRGEARTLLFRAAAAIEVMADFTDWLPVTLESTGPDLWSVTLPITPGRHRLNVRMSGGPWGVPAGTTPVADDFLGMVGAVIVP